MRLEYLTYWLLCATVSWALTQDIIKQLPKCKHTDTECVLKLMGKLLTIHDPLSVERLQISQNNNGPIGIKFEYKNATIVGLGQSVIKQASGFSKNPDGMKLDVRFDVPKLSMNGPYVAHGKVMVFSIRGDGQANITFENQQVRLRMLTKKVDKGDGKNYMQIEKVKMDFDVSGLTCYFTNLFNGDKILEETINEFFNENWRDILQEVKPVVSKAIGKVYMDTINKFTENMPYSDIFID